VSTARKEEELFRILHQGTTQVMEGKGKVTWDVGTKQTKPDISLGSSELGPQILWKYSGLPSLSDRRMHIKRHLGA